MGPDIYKYSRLFSFPDISKWARQQLLHTINPGTRTASRGAGRSPPGPCLGVGLGGGQALALGRQVPVEPQALQDGCQPGVGAAPGGFGEGGKAKINLAAWCTRAVQRPTSQLTHPASFMIPGDNAVDFAEFVCLGFFILLLEKVVHVIFFPLKANMAMPAATVTESSPGSPVSESRLWRPWGTSVHRHLERVGVCQSHGRSGGDEWGCSHKYPEKCRILRTAPLCPLFNK